MSNSGDARLLRDLQAMTVRENEAAHRLLDRLGVRRKQSRAPYQLGLKRRIELLVEMMGGVR